MKARWVKKGVKIAVMAVLAVGVFGFLVMSLWNWLVPAVFGLVLVGGLLVLNSGLTAGILVAFVLYVEQLYTPLRDLAQRWTMVQAAFASGDQV